MNETNNDNFYIDVMKKSILKGKKDKAFSVSKKINEEIVKQELLMLILRKSGVDDEIISEFIIEYDNINRDMIKNYIQKINISSGSMENLLHSFYNSFINNDYEPFPENQKIIIENPEEGIKYAAAMFMKGMSIQFWDMIYSYLDNNDKILVDKLRTIPIHTPYIWVFAISLTYFYLNLEWPSLTGSDYELKLEYGKIMEPPSVCSDYFDIVFKDNNTIENVKSDDTYTFIKTENLTKSKYNFEEIIKFSTAKSKKQLHIHDLGTIQIPNISKNNKSYPFYCWLKVNDELKRFFLKPYTMKSLAHSANEANNLMTDWCYPSNVINLGEIIDKNRIIDKKCYYTINPASRNHFPINCVQLDSYNEIYIINVMKYILGIQNRNCDNCGVYFTDEGQKICSFSHGPILKDLKRPICKDLDINLAKLFEYKQWLENIQLNMDKRFYIRIREIITSF